MTAHVTAMIVAIGLFATLLSPARAQAAGAIGVRYSTSADTVRIVLDLPAAVTYTDLSTPQQVQVSLDWPLAEAAPVITVDDSIAASIALAPDANGRALLTVTLKKARKFTLFTLKPDGRKPDRLVVDIHKRFRTETVRALSPAITHTRIEQQTDTEYRHVHFIEADLQDPHLRVGVAAAEGERERVSEMVARTGAVCGINAGYFMQGTRPVGLLKADGRLLAMPLWGRTAVAFSPTGGPVFGNPKGAWRVTLPDGSERDLPDWLDASVLIPPPAAVAYNGNLFTQVPANANGLTALIQGGKVVLRSTEVVPLLPGDLALRLLGDEAKALDALLAMDAPVTVTPLLEPAWETYLHAVGAGPRLLQNGQPSITGQEERFKPDVLLGRNARSGLGVTQHGTLVLVAVEGPSPYGGGATLEELAGLLKSRRAVDALNLDGGGSSTLAIGAETVNVRPGSWIRPVASGILLFDDRVQTKAVEPASAE